MTERADRRRRATSAPIRNEPEQATNKQLIDASNFTIDPVKQYIKSGITKRRHS